MMPTLTFKEEIQSELEEESSCPCCGDVYEESCEDSDESIYYEEVGQEPIYFEAAFEEVSLRDHDYAEK